jgi:hypothetical protein
VAAGETPAAPEPAEEAVIQDAAAEPERDSSGDFREPHAEESGESPPPEDISPAHGAPLSETAVSSPAEMAPSREPEPERERRPERPERPAYPEQRRPEPKPWTRPADFRPAETSAISQAVAHATEIAESLKHTIDQLDEILELVEIAERQKLADEREIEELRRALRRIQPPRHQPQHPARGPRYEEPQRGPREHGPRHEERYSRHEPRPEENQRPEEPRQPETGEPPARLD